MTISENTEKLLKQRYLLKNETFGGMIDRVIKAVIPNENYFYKQQVFKDLSERVWFPNSPCLFNANTKTGGLMACFVVGPNEDNVENHVETLGDIALVAKRGGGCGFTGTHIRPENAPVAGSTHGFAYGPNAYAVRIAEYMQMMTQSGKRGMALMYTLRSDHPDLEKFVDLKQTDDESFCTAFNQSVMATNDFMYKALSYGTTEHSIFEKIVFNMWNNGEPGFLFYDTINNNTPYKFTNQTIEATNPCGEQPLPSYGACNLGSINLAHNRFFKNGYFQFSEFEKTVQDVTRFLDCIGSATTFPNHKFEDWYNQYRPIGVGLMGFADCLLRMGYAFGDTNSLNFLNSVSEILLEVSQETSEELGQEKGIPTGNKQFGRRNITTTSIAPTGSIAMLAECSHSLEPVFSESYLRTDFKGETYTYFHPFANEEYFRSAINEDSQKIVSWKDHLNVQIIAQQHIDSGVSKTINFPEDATLQQVKNAVLYAWQNGAKGITVYRNNSRNVQVLKTQKKEEEKQPEFFELKDESFEFACPNGVCEL